MQQGYKQTEVGLIPEDWNLTPIGDIADFQGGSQPDIKYFTNRETKDNIRLIQIRDYKSDKYITYIPLCLAKRFCSKDDIMIGRYGPPIFQILRGLEGAYNVALIKTIPKNVCKEFLYYVLKDQKLFEYIELLSRRSSGQTGVDLEGLRNYTIPCPSLPEQSRIAEALSDVDSMISSIEKLIAKKKAIKQGAMQELLTGKKRLSGFTGEWTEKTISQYGNFVSGNGFPLKYQGNPSGLYPFYKVSDFSNVGNGRAMIKANNYVSSVAAVSLSCNIIPKNSIVFAKIGAAIALERKRITTCDCCIDNNMMSFQPHQKEIASYMCYLFQTIRFGELVEATALPSLSGRSIGEIKKPFPPTTEEQTAIASILFDMDNEIEALEQKLAKTRQLKQGMMQQLLTGKIRLV